MNTITALTAVRAALAKGLSELGLNVSAGDDITPPGAAVSAFDVEYHKTVGGKPGRATAHCSVRVVTSRADPAAAYEALDAAMTTVWSALESTPGPWLSLLVTDGGPGEPLTIGQATYGVAVFALDVYL